MQKHQNQQAHKEKSDDSPPRRANEALKYSGMAVQMGVIIWIGTFLGQKGDAYFQTESPYFAALGALLGLFAAFYLIFKDLMKGK